MGSVEVTSIDPVKLVRSNNSRHAVRIMASGQQCPIDASQHLPSRVPGSKGDVSRCGGRVGIGNSGPKLTFSLFGKGDKPGCRNRRRIDSDFCRGCPFAVAQTIQKTGLHRPRSTWPEPSLAQEERSDRRRSPGERTPLVAERRSGCQPFPVPQTRPSAAFPDRTGTRVVQITSSEE